MADKSESEEDQSTASETSEIRVEELSTVQPNVRQPDLDEDTHNDYDGQRLVQSEPLNPFEQPDDASVTISLPLPPRRFKRNLNSLPTSRATSRQESVQRELASVRFSSEPNLVYQRPSSGTVRKYLKGAIVYAGLLAAYICSGSVLLFVMWSWFPLSPLSDPTDRVADELTLSLWNLTLTYNVLNEQQWRLEASHVIRDALPQVSSVRHLPPPSITSALLISLSLTSTTGLPSCCIPEEHDIIGTKVFTILFPLVGIPLFVYSLCQSSKCFSDAIKLSPQRTQLRWTFILLGLMYILALGPIVLGDGLLPTLLAFSLIGPFPCNAQSSTVRTLASISYAFIGYYLIAFIVRLIVDLFATAKPDQNYANVKLKRKLTFRKSLNRIRNRWHHANENKSSKV